jgi:hypothetical protein
MVSVIVMISVLAPIVLDRGFEPLADQTKDYKIGICCFSAKHATLRSQNKDGIRIMCPSGAACLIANCCFSELTLLKSNLHVDCSVGLMQSGQVSSSSFHLMYFVLTTI